MILERQQQAMPSFYGQIKMFFFILRAVGVLQGSARLWGECVFVCVHVYFRRRGDMILARWLIHHMGEAV